MVKDLKLVQFNFVDYVRTLALEWSAKNEICLLNIEYEIPFVFADKSLTVWLIFDTNKRVKEYSENGIIEKIKEEFLNILCGLEYPPDYLKKVAFMIGAEEKIVNDYDGKMAASPLYAQLNF
ncbi:MAG: hypothetical protein ABI723_25705 [Bacteroidia bacterium]